MGKKNVKCGRPLVGYFVDMLADMEREAVKFLKQVNYLIIGEPSYVGNIYVKEKVYSVLISGARISPNCHRTNPVIQVRVYIDDELAKVVTDVPKYEHHWVSINIFPRTTQWDIFARIINRSEKDEVVTDNTKEDSYNIEYTCSVTINEVSKFKSNLDCRDYAGQMKKEVFCEVARLLSEKWGVNVSIGNEVMAYKKRT